MKDQRQYDERLIRVEDKVDAIMGNHLVHLDQKIDNLSNSVDKIIWLIITTLIGIVFLLVKGVK